MAKAEERRGEQKLKCRYVRWYREFLSGKLSDSENPKDLFGDINSVSILLLLLLLLFLFPLHHLNLLEPLVPSGLDTSPTFLPTFFLPTFLLGGKRPVGKKFRERRIQLTSCLYRRHESLQLRMRECRGSVIRVVVASLTRSNGLQFGEWRMANNEQDGKL